MNRTPVSSSNVASIGYDPSTQTLEVQYHSGLYQYFGVPASVHDLVMRAPSKGGALDEHVKKAGYRYRRIG